MRTKIKFELDIILMQKINTKKYIYNSEPYSNKTKFWEITKLKRKIKITS